MTQRGADGRFIKGGEIIERLAGAQFPRESLISRIVLTVEGNSKREAPVRTGTLRRSITSRVERTGERGAVGTNLVYGRAVHEGTKPHIIRPKGKKALFWKGARHPVASVRHPGTRGNPFLTRGLATSRDTIDDLLAEAGAELFTEITK